MYDRANAYFSRKINTFVHTPKAQSPVVYTDTSLNL